MKALLLSFLLTPCAFAKDPTTPGRTLEETPPEIPLCYRASRGPFSIASAAVYSGAGLIEPDRHIFSITQLGREFAHARYYGASNHGLNGAPCRVGSSAGTENISPAFERLPAALSVWTA